MYADPSFMPRPIRRVSREQTPRWHQNLAILLRASALVCAVLIPTSLPAQTTPYPITLPSTPWFLATGTPPNIILTLDDSDSMDDRIGYDPNGAYDLPPGFAEPSFYAAPVDGYGVTSRATTDLSSCRSSSCNACSSLTDTASQKHCARWYSFYRSKINTTKSSALLAFKELPDSYRVGWQGINTCQNFSPTAACQGNIGVFDIPKRAAFHRWITGIKTDGNTPLRRALIRVGEYLKTDAPNLSDPTDPTSAKLSCRANYAITMTDGLWNDSSVTVGNVDNTHQTVPASDTQYGNLNDATLRRYKPSAPFSDTYADTLADIAFKYWATDLRPDIDNNVTPQLSFAKDPQKLTYKEFWNPQNNPATWQHMTGFFIGLKLKDKLDKNGLLWSGSTFQGTGYNNLASGGMDWPEAKSNSANNVYDLWHAAINSRGGLYLADDSRELVAAFNAISSTISDREASVTGGASSGLNVQTDSAMFTASFSTRDWSGGVRKFDTSGLSNSAKASPKLAWSTDTTLKKNGADFLATWDWLRNKAVGRGILTPNQSGSLHSMKADTDPSSTLPPTNAAFLNTHAAALGATVPELVNWILGQTKYEGIKFRARDHYLGDIVDSAPLYEAGRDYGYATTAWTTGIDGQNYGAFLASQAGKGAKPTVYVGANDGLLHAINANNGTLRFAFLPSPSFENLLARAQPQGAHKWFVNGPITTHHAHNGKEWRTILVASMGAGAKGLFALDVTDPDNPSLLWEWFPDGRDPDAGDVGHILGEPVIAATNGGNKWIVAFGNGVGSTNNRPALFILDLFTGQRLLKAYGGAMPGNAAGNIANGLSAPALLYLPGRVLSAAYAGDLAGKLWRFDLSAIPKTATESTINTPLFEARSKSTGGTPGAMQPITAKPRIASDRKMGRFIMFGTGRLLLSADKNHNQVQSVYGIRDRDMAAPGATSVKRSDLLEQTIKPGSQTRNITTRGYSGAADGWVIDLPESGERVISPVTYIPEATMAVVTSVVPSASMNTCAASDMASWIMTVSPFSGAGLEVLEDAAVQHAGLKQEGSIAPPTPVRTGGGSMSLLVNKGSSGLLPLPVTSLRNSRSSWQQLR